MKGLITETIGGESYRYYPLGNHVVQAVGVCGGRPTFKYTRIEITGTLERLAAGENIDDIVRGYRNRVPHEAVVEALRFRVISNNAPSDGASGGEFSDCKGTEDRQRRASQSQTDPCTLRQGTDGNSPENAGRPSVP